MMHTGKLSGEYFHSLDAKGRLVIPNELKCHLGQNFYLAKGIEKCLTIYSQQEWIKLSEKIELLPSSNPDVRALVRFLGSGTKECQTDSQGRIILPASLREHAGIEKKAVLVGLFNKVEIWNEDSWNALCSNDYKGELSISESLAAKIRELGI